MKGPELMLLAPACKDYLWGGSRLIQEYDKQSSGEILAETWECSTHPDGPSMVLNGSYAGQTLDRVIRSHPDMLGTRFSGERELPILVKLIDARQNLSVQVHPDDTYARANEGQNGKTEFWYILDAKPGAQLVHGFEHPMTAQLMKHAIRTGTLNKHLQHVPVKCGDTFYIPSGTVHAIGADILLVEIQESSNVTYRLYDYDRMDKNGQKRVLHIEQALQVLDMRSGHQIHQRPRTIRFEYGCMRQMLCRCPYFEVERFLINGQIDFQVSRDSFQVLLCLKGKIDLGAGRCLEKGRCAFLPAGFSTYLTGKGSELLRVSCG